MTESEMLHELFENEDEQQFDDDFYDRLGDQDED